MRRSQASVDLAAELRGSRSDEACLSARKKNARPLEAYNERHRRIVHFGIERVDGSIAATPEEASWELEAHSPACYGVAAAHPQSQGGELLRPDRLRPAAAPARLHRGLRARRRQLCSVSRGPYRAAGKRFLLGQGPREVRSPMRCPARAPDLGEQDLQVRHALLVGASLLGRTCTLQYNDASR